MGKNGQRILKDINKEPTPKANKPVERIDFDGRFPMCDLQKNAN